MTPTYPEPANPGDSGREAPNQPDDATGLSSSRPANSRTTASAPWFLALAAGVLAGILSGAGGELAWGKVRSAQVPKIVPYPTAEDRARVIRAQVGSTSITFVQQGAILGAVLGLAGGLSRRSVRGGLVASATGAVLGAAVTAAAARLLLPVYFWNVEPQESDLTIPLLTHGGIWAAVGATAGLAFGLGRGDRGEWARGALGGLLGGIAATMVYDVIGALAFPLDKTSQPVSATVATRLLAQLLVALMVAGGAALGAGGTPRKSST